MDSKKKLTPPEILETEVVAQSRLFKVEQLKLKFSNGAERVYERMKGSGRGAVMTVAITEQNELLLVREYCAGTNDYQLGFPKGLIDPGESPEQAANRELMEEAGMGARQWQFLHQVHMAPAFFDAKMQIFIATDLYQQALPGDEPEPLEVVKWPMEKWQELLLQDDFNEARCIAALMLARSWWEAYAGNSNK